MNESTWHPQPGDRVLIRNAGEYGWGGLSELNVMVHHNQGNRPAELVRVFDALSTGRPVTVLRSDLFPVEPPKEWPCNSLGPIHLYPRFALALEGWSVERHTGPETEEPRRLTKEDYADIDQVRKSLAFDEMVAELVETISPDFAELWRARTRKEGK